MQSKVKIIKTNDGFMVELPNGDYLEDAHGDNLWDTEAQAEEVVALNYVDLRNYIDYGRKHNTLLEALALLDKATTLIYNMEGDTYQQAYEKLEEVISQLKGEAK